MSETVTHELQTDQASREASGAHKYGRYLEEFEVGAVYKHWPAKTDMDGTLVATFKRAVLVPRKPESGG